MSVSIDEFKALVAPDVIGAPDPLIEREIISSILEFCDKTNSLNREFTFDVDSDYIDDSLQNSLDFDMNLYAAKLRPIRVLNLMVDTTKFLPKERNIQATHDNWEYIKETYTNIKYYWFPYDHIIRLYDMETTDKKIWIQISYKPLRTSTTFDDFLYEDHNEAIVYKAKSKLLLMPGKPWTDKESGEWYRRQWRRYLSRAKAQAIREKDGNEARVRWIEFSGGV